MNDIASLGAATAAAVDPKKPASQEMGQETFLKLLITQLSNQDPMDPADSKEFVAQLSQFASLEQLTTLGKKMDDLITISGASNAANAVSLLGKDVRVDTDSLRGNSTVYYELAGEAKSVNLEVRDNTGKVVKYIGQLPTERGLQTVKIDDLVPGEYTFRLETKDSLGKEVEAQLSVGERVKGINFSEGTPVLMMESGAMMKASDVVEIRDPGKMI